MSSSSLQSKTVRPGNLVSYTYYSSRRSSGQTPTKSKTKTKRSHHGRWVLAVLVVLVVGGLLFGNQIKTDFKSHNVAAKTTSNKTTTPPKATAPAPKTTTPAPAVAAAPNPCAGNELDELIKVSISQRELWACNTNTEVYSSPVVTGMDMYAADTTPTGTFHIYAKYTDQYLKGSDQTGSWDDFVNYWMPFLSNGYGVFGLHDATWRSPSDFGNISPDSTNASHGCVELPLATAKWLYDWSVVGTTVTIVS